MHQDSQNRLIGILFALASYVIWGLFPLYWKALQAVPATETLAHRVIWSVAVVAIVLSVVRRWHVVWQVFRSRRQLMWLMTSALFISTNWLAFILAVNWNQVLQASMGYYLAPLISILLGYTVFQERLNLLHWLAVALAAAGVLNLIIFYNDFPWLGLTLAFSFGGYGALRKFIQVDSISGLFVETLLLMPVALLWLGWLHISAQQTFLVNRDMQDLLLVCAGIATATPLLFYVAATKCLQLTTVGILSYVTPTLQFLLGIFVYHEPMTMAHVITFVLIWMGLLLYSIESHRQTRYRPPDNI